MKLEKVNDHQIRCTLTREDLAVRQLKISELAYGTDKAKQLFHDMMQQASFEFGFEAEDIPLMIEAIPVNSECIVLIITKVEDPEELDTRFSKFAPSIHDAIDDDTLEDLEELPPPSEERPFSEEIAELFHKIQKAKEDAAASQSAKADGVSKAPAAPIVRMFSFHGLQPVIRLAGIIGEESMGDNALYKAEDGSYVLSLGMGELSPTAFGRICNIVSEYGNAMAQLPGNEAYFEEHFSPVIKADALKNLAGLSK